MPQIVFSSFSSLKNLLPSIEFSYNTTTLRYWYYSISQQFFFCVFLLVFIFSPFDFICAFVGPRNKLKNIGKANCLNLYSPFYVTGSHGIFRNNWKAKIYFTRITILRGADMTWKNINFGAEYTFQRRSSLSPCYLYFISKRLKML